MTRFIRITMSADKQPLVAILAAGKASRFGGGKLDAMLGIRRVGDHVLDAVHDAGLAPGIIVTGETVPAFAKESGWRLVANPDPKGGLASSLALAASECADTSRLLVLLADMPLVLPRHLQGLLRREGTSATAYPGGIAGVPACFTPECVKELAGLHGDRGAGPLLARIEGVRLVEPPPDTLLDIDTPEDLARAEAILSG